MVNLPADIITEILSRLPVTSLLRFRSISKSWKSLIDSHDFTALHLKFHKLNSDPNVIFTFHPELYAVDLPNLDYVDLNQPLKSYENNIPLFEKSITILGSCNGLLCIQNSLDDIAIWNPSLRKHWILPRLTSFRYPCYGGFGFGFDSFTGDYKLVTISEFKYVGDPYYFVSEVSIFSCRTNSWETLTNVPNPFSQIYTMGVFVGHALHWNVYDDCGKDVGSNLIVAFDLTSELFNKVPLPELDEGFEIWEVV